MAYLALIFIKRTVVEAGGNGWMLLNLQTINLTNCCDSALQYADTEEIWAFGRLCTEFGSLLFSTNSYYFSTNPSRGSQRVKSGGEGDVKKKE